MIGPTDVTHSYITLPYRVARIDGKYFVSVDHGGWALLDEDQFRRLRSHTVYRDPDLFVRLRSAGIIATEDDDPLEKMKKRFWYLQNGSSLHIVAVTNKCNFACKYCYANPSKPIDMSRETAEKVVDFIFQTPAKALTIEFSGGEPLLNFEAIKTIVERAKKLGKRKNKEIAFAMIHNGSAWDEEKAEFFMKEQIGICFSLDGPRDLHNLHRVYHNGGGTYDDVVRWIKYFREAGYSHLNAIPVITRHSLPRGKEIVDEYMKWHFDSVRFKYLGYFGRAREFWNEIGYSPDEFVKAWKEVMEYIYSLYKRGFEIVEDMARTMAAKLFNYQDPGFCELEMPCGAGLNQLAYSPDGGVYTCDEGRMFEEFRIGNVDMKWSEVMKSSVLKAMILTSSGYFDRCDACAFKPFCGLCPVESYSLEKNINSKIPLNRRCRIYRGMLTYLIRKSSRDERFREMLISWAKSRKAGRTFYY